MSDIHLLIDARCRLGESPVWDERAERLWWVDIEGRAVHSAGADGTGHESWRVDTRPAALGLTERTSELVLALEGGIHLWTPGEAPRLVAPIEVDEPRTRCNDGKIGPDGAFWIGTMNEAGDDPIAAVWRVTPDGAVERKISGLMTSNGLAWTGDGRAMFHSDSRAGVIDRYAFDPATGTLSERTRIATLPEEAGHPDGGACDVEGGYWSAGVGAGCLNRFDRDGTLVEPIAMPVEMPTCPCFGGAGLRRLFVTSLGGGEDAGEAGGIHVLDPGIAGVPAFRFGVGIALRR